jgi:hypothetical protein
VIMRICLLEALDYERRDLHPIKLSYLAKDRAFPLSGGIKIQVAHEV